MSDVNEEFPQLSTMDAVGLVNRADILRKELSALKPDDSPEDIQLKKLRELAYIAGVLRRRSNPDPNGAKKRTTKTRAPAPSLDSIL